jgi:hemolysin III
MKIFHFRQQNKTEEIANTISHGLGLLFFLIAIPLLWIKKFPLYSSKGILAIIIFSIGLICVYSFSTLYHAFQKISIKNKLRVFDHISIFLLIGGSYTFIVWRYIHIDIASPFLIIMWSLIAGGIILKLFFTHRFRLLSTIFYLLLGLMGLFITRPLLNNIPQTVLVLIAVGGAMYIFGTLFYMMKNVRYTHTIWHFFVFGGSFFHYLAIYYSA